MVDATTPNLGLTKPTVGADNNTWGGLLNDDLDIVDALFENTGPTPLDTAATKPIGTSGAAVPLLNGANTWSVSQTFTLAPSFTDQPGSRTALGLGTAATANTGTSGVAVPLLNGANTWSAQQTFSVGIVANVTGNVSGSSSSCTGNAATASVAASCSGNAATATNAGHASSADSATNAGHASSADSATNAGHAGAADSAGALINGDGATISFAGELQRWNISVTGNVIIAYIDASGLHTV